MMYLLFWHIKWNGYDITYKDGGLYERVFFLDRQGLAVLLLLN